VGAPPVIELLDAEAARELPPQRDDWAELARRYVVAMQRDGTSHYIDNVEVDLSLLRVDEQLLPLVVTQCDRPTDPSRPIAAVASPRAHYADYTREEMAKRHLAMPGWLLGLGFRPLGAAMGLAELDRVVFVNNWLLTTNPVARYTAEQLSAIVDGLTKKYPKAAVVFGGLLPRLQPEQFRLFEQVGFRMVRHRRVWIVEDCERAFRESEELHRDRHLAERHGYEVVADPEVIASEAERLAELYRGLYLGKHSLLNPHFNAEFVRLTLDEGLLTYRAFRKAGAIDAFKAWYVKDGVMTGAFVGYDRQKPRKLGLYRQAIALQATEAARLGLQLSWSGGVGEFKRLRGASPHEEHDAVWDRHLSARRRLPWALLERVGRATVGR
jgi:hypothetical protein